MKRLRLQAGSNEYDRLCIICGEELADNRNSMNNYWCTGTLAKCNKIKLIPIPTECLNLPVERDWSQGVLEIT